LILEFTDLHQHEWDFDVCGGLGEGPASVALRVAVGE